MAKAYETKLNETLNTTGTGFFDAIDFQGFDAAQQFELKIDVSAGDGSCDFQVQTSDDGTTWFDVDSATFTIAAVGQDGVILDAQGNYMRVAYDYTHNTADTAMQVFMLVR